MRHSSRCSIALLLAACSHSGSAGTAPDAGSSADAGSGSASPDGGSVPDGGSTTGLPLGTVTVTQASVACGKDAAPGAKCEALSVACPGIPDLAVTIADVEPAGGATMGTIVSHDGGS